MDKRDLAVVEKLYSEIPSRISKVRELFKRPLTLTEKILFTHIAKLPDSVQERGAVTLDFLPDRVAMQDATAQMAMLQFMTTRLETAKVPASIHCDHLIRAQSGSKEDLLRAVDENREVYEFLRTSAERYGIGFWEPGSGIIHQVVLEQYAFPGGMIIGTDSHTPNAGGLGMLAIGVGGADAVDVMAGFAWGLLNPKLIGVKLTGKLNGWASAKDVILKVAGMLTVEGGTGKIIEYFGEGAESISCTGKATITNMGAELGATTSVFAYDPKMAEYLKATERGNIADLADKISEHLKADIEIYQNPEKYYDQVIEIDLSKLEPQWVGPHTPDLLRKVSEMPEVIKKENYPEDIAYALIGSCTNSSYEDISRAASLARQAQAAGLKVKAPLLVTPGSDQVYQTIKRDGLLDVFLSVGATVLANACGPCIGQWKRTDALSGKKNTIVTSYNRNFAKRNDGSADTLAFVGSPELVTAVAFAGKLSFNPLTDTLADGLKFNIPQGSELPAKGFSFSKFGFIAPIEDSAKRQAIEVKIDPKSERLAKLDPFEPWSGEDFKDLVLLVKAKGKCTTDHISQAGPWLKYRGHLPNISKNTYLGAVNFFNGEAGKGSNILSGEVKTFPEIAEDYRKAGQGWIMVGDQNYGEGSSREHAAMQPRYLGCRAVIVKSIARIAETNLKKQGVLPLIFENPADYDLIGEKDRFDLTGLKDLALGSKVKLIIKTAGGQKEVLLKHSLTAEQIEWFKAGSALNTSR
jgi:aconitate hydratase